MIRGYSRVSTAGQARDGNSLEAQTETLRANGAEIIYSDVYTGTKKDRPEFTRLLEDIRDGDIVMVTKLDRLARSAKQGMESIEEIESKGGKVHILNMGGVMDDSTTGRLIRNVMLCFAEFERDMIVERTREGKQIAKQRADFREGRPKKYSEKRVSEAVKLLDSHSYKEVAEITGISVSTLVRAKRDMRSQSEI